MLFPPFAKLAVWIRSKNFNPIWPVRVNWWTWLIYLMNQCQGGSWGFFSFLLVIKNCKIACYVISFSYPATVISEIYLFCPAFIDKMFLKISFCVSAWDKALCFGCGAWHHCQSKRRKISSRLWVCFFTASYKLLNPVFFARFLLLFKSHFQIFHTQKYSQPVSFCF